MPNRFGSFALSRCGLPRRQAVRPDSGGRNSPCSSTLSVVDTYGASEDWDADLSARLALKFFDSLSAEERAHLGLSERKRTTRQLMDLLRACNAKVGRIPLLIFDQFDDYQNIHREQFLRDWKWITF